MTSANFNRPGAVDLSGLAARVKQSAGGNTGGVSYVLGVDEQNFDAVVSKSIQHPVILEFHSDRAGAQAFSADLASVVNTMAGKLLLARVDVDVNPRIAAAVQVKTVPTVVALIGGQVAPLFQGPATRSQIQAMLDQVVQLAVANGMVGRAAPVAAPADDTSQPEQLAADPRFAAADEALENGDFALAVTEFEKILAQTPNDPEAIAGRAQAGLLARATGADVQKILAAAGSTQLDVEAQLGAADIEMLAGKAEAAFARLIRVIRLTSGDERNKVRIRLLELFETLGNNDPLVLKARRDLMSALF